MSSTTRPQSATAALDLSDSVDILQHRARQVNDRTLQSTRVMVGLIDESKEVGVRTLVNLHEQGEKLNHIEEANREMKDKVHESEKTLTEMEKCCGLFVLPWKVSKSSSGSKNVWKKNKEEVVERQPEKVSEDPYPNGLLPRITNDAVEDEAESNLSHVLSTVRDLKGIAANMRDETRAQNDHLDKLVQQAENNDIRVQAVEKRTNNIHR